MSDENLDNKQFWWPGMWKIKLRFLRHSDCKICVSIYNNLVWSAALYVKGVVVWHFVLFCEYPHAAYKLQTVLLMKLLSNRIVNHDLIIHSSQKDDSISDAHKESSYWMNWNSYTAIIMTRTWDIALNNFMKTRWAIYLGKRKHSYKRDLSDKIK